MIHISISMGCSFGGLLLLIQTPMQVYKQVKGIGDAYMSSLNLLKTLVNCIVLYRDVTGGRKLHLGSTQVHKANIAFVSIFSQIKSVNFTGLDPKRSNCYTLGVLF